MSLCFIAVTFFANPSRAPGGIGEKPELNTPRCFSFFCVLSLLLQDQPGSLQLFSFHTFGSFW